MFVLSGYCVTGDSPSDPLLLTFCGNEVPEVRSTGRFLYVTFTSDSTVNYRGFNAKYMTELSEIPLCVTTDIYANLTATTEYQNFTSPGYPDQYN
ncbi:TLL1-like protein, partial [Mya arenaria]